MFNLIEKLKAEKISAAYIDLNAHPDIQSLAVDYALQTCKALETNRDNMWDLAQKHNKVTSGIVEKLPAIIARQDSPHYELFWRTASPLQKKILIALSKEPNLKPLSKEFALRYQISPPSSIKASLVSLIKKGIIYRRLEGSYRFTDHFMPYWVESII